MSVERAIMNLERELEALAQSALDQPQSRDAFEYGRMVGMYAGLKRAKAVLTSTITAEDDDV
jgi:hypothetical protein